MPCLRHPLRPCPDFCSIERLAAVRFAQEHKHQVILSGTRYVDWSCIDKSLITSGDQIAAWIDGGDGCPVTQGEIPYTEIIRNCMHVIHETDVYKLVREREVEKTTTKHLGSWNRHNELDKSIGKGEMPDTSITCNCLHRKHNIDVYRLVQEKKIDEKAGTRLGLWNPYETLDKNPVKSETPCIHIPQDYLHIIHETDVYELSEKNQTEEKSVKHFGLGSFQNTPRIEKPRAELSDSRIRHDIPGRSKGEIPYTHMTDDYLHVIHEKDVYKSVQKKQIGETLAKRLGLWNRHDTPDEFIANEIMLPTRYELPQHVARPTGSWTAWDACLNIDNDGVAGYSTPGVMALTYMRRSTEDAPHVCDVALAMYRKAHKTLDGLAYIIACDVGYGQTLDAIQLVLGGDIHSLLPQKLRTFKRISEGYARLLGTRIGRIVGYGIIRAFGQESYRISHISVYTTRQGGPLHLRFDLQPFPQARPQHTWGTEWSSSER